MAAEGLFASLPPLVSTTGYDRVGYDKIEFNWVGYKNAMV